MWEFLTNRFFVSAKYSIVVINWRQIKNSHTHAHTLIERHVQYSVLKQIHTKTWTWNQNQKRKGKSNFRLCNFDFVIFFQMNTELTHTRKANSNQMILMRIMCSWGVVNINIWYGKYDMVIWLFIVLDLRQNSFEHKPDLNKIKWDKCIWCKGVVWWPEERRKGIGEKRCTTKSIFWLFHTQSFPVRQGPANIHTSENICRNLDSLQL